MPYCPHCGHEVQEGKIYCGSCGQPLARPPPHGQPASLGRLITILGALGLLVGAALPWASVTSIFGTVSISGLDGDGRITGAIGVLLLVSALLARGKPGRRYSLASAAFAFIGGLLVVWKIIHIGNIAADEEYILASAGMGLYVSAIGALIAFIGGLQKTSR